MNIGHGYQVSPSEGKVSLMLEFSNLQAADLATFVERSMASLASARFPDNKDHNGNHSQHFDQEINNELKEFLSAYESLVRFIGEMTGSDGDQQIEALHSAYREIVKTIAGSNKELLNKFCSYLHEQGKDKPVLSTIAEDLLLSNEIGCPLPVKIIPTSS